MKLCQDRPRLAVGRRGAVQGVGGLSSPSWSNLNLGDIPHRCANARWCCHISLQHDGLFRWSPTKRRWSRWIRCLFSTLTLARCIGSPSGTRFGCSAARWPRSTNRSSRLLIRRRESLLVRVQPREPSTGAHPVGGACPISRTRLGSTPARCTLPG